MDKWQESNFSVFEFSDRAALATEASVENKEKKRKRTGEIIGLKKQVAMLKETNQRRGEDIVKKRHTTAKDKQQFSKRLKATVKGAEQEA